MSVVAVRKIGKRFEMASDSIIVRGWTQGKEPFGKMWKVGDMLAGTAGYSSIGGLFREHIENHKPKTNNEWGWINFMSDFTQAMKKVNDKLSIDENEFLVVWKGKAFRLHASFARQIKKYDAIGAGMDFALAALHLKHSAKEACEIACELSAFCEKPVQRLVSKP